MRADCREDRHGGPCLRAPHRRSRAAPRHMSRWDGANGTNPRWPIASAILELLPFFGGKRGFSMVPAVGLEPTTYRLQGGRSEEHTSELQSLMRISYAVFCLKKKIITN